MSGDECPVIGPGEWVPRDLHDQIVAKMGHEIDVLRRALEIATQTHLEVFSETAFRTADDWIEHARELESEGNRDNS